MGCTCSDDSKNKSENRPNRNQYKNHEVSRRRENNNNIIINDSHDEIQRNLVEPYLQSRVDPSFNFPEVKEEIYVGKGYKKMKGYISNIPEEELIKKRSDFWATRVEGNAETWKFLQEICENKEEDNDENINAYLQAYGVKPYKKCLNVTYDLTGGLYEIPNYCINDPVKYELPNTNKEKPDERRITFYIRKEGNIIKVSKSNYFNIFELKKYISNKLNAEPEKIRLFFGGKEMKNEQELWFYNVDDKSNIIGMVSN